MALHTPISRAALLALAALTCGPKPSATDTSPGATDTSGGVTSDSDTLTGPTVTSDGDTLTGTTDTSGDPAPIDACTLVPEPGSCNAAFDGYFFDPVTGQCQIFTWGGCDGVVPFTDFVACQNACDPCEAFFAVAEPPPVSPPVEITIRNDTQAPVFLRTYTWDGKAAFRTELFELWSPGGSAPLSTNPNACDFACGTPTDGECELACGDSGGPPNPRMLIPGGALKLQWGGQHMAQVDVPARCLPAECDAFNCGRWLDATPGGLYEVRVDAAESWTCYDPECCVPNPDGWCDVTGPPEYNIEDDYTVELVAPFTFPGGPLELTFQ